MGFINLYILLAQFVFLFSSIDCNNQLITYGSSIVIIHEGSNARLYSSNISWKSESNDHIVTAFPENKFNQDFIWIVKHPHPIQSNNEYILQSIDKNEYNQVKKTSQYIKAGTPIKCGDIIRLEHASTRKNLHGSKNPSFLITKNYHVTNHGNNGVGDADDNFVVKCLSNSNDNLWKEKMSFQLHHVNSDRPLQSVAKIKYNQSNCPRCVIIDHQEISISYSKSQSNDTRWIAEGFILIDSTDHEDDNSEQPLDKDQHEIYSHTSTHDEL